MATHPPTGLYVIGYGIHPQRRTQQLPRLKVIRVGPVHGVKLFDHGCPQSISRSLPLRLVEV